MRLIALFLLFASTSSFSWPLIGVHPENGCRDAKTLEDNVVFDRKNSLTVENGDEITVYMRDYRGHKSQSLLRCSKSDLVEYSITINFESKDSAKAFYKETIREIEAYFGNPSRSTSLQPARTAYSNFQQLTGGNPDGEFAVWIGPNNKQLFLTLDEYAKGWEMAWAW